MSKLQISTQNFQQAPCSHFGICGGCSYQDVPYNEQLSQKQAFIAELFQQIPNPIIASKTPFAYRNKMEFSFSEAKDGQKFLGLMQKKSKVITLKECHLVNSWQARFLAQVYDWWQKNSLPAYRPFKNCGYFRTLTLREALRTQEKMAILSVSCVSDRELSASEINSFLELCDGIESVVLRKQVSEKKQPTYFVETLLKGKGYLYEHLFDEQKRCFSFKIRPSSFFQPNTFCAEILYQKAVEMIKGEVLFDLYCGTATIGIFASSKVKRIYGVEESYQAVLDGEENLARNEVSNMKIFQGDVGELLDRLPEKPDTILIDPPRSGLSEKAMGHLCTLKAPRIIYISCNPVSQRHDCLKLPYKIKTLQPVDQFPHTRHLENIALLELA